VMTPVVGSAFPMPPRRPPKIDLVGAGQSADRRASESADESTCCRVSGCCTDDSSGSGADQAARYCTIAGIRSAPSQKQRRHRQCCDRHLAKHETLFLEFDT
jgi:hypothetical protein